MKERDEPRNEEKKDNSVVDIAIKSVASSKPLNNVLRKLQKIILGL